MDEVTREQVRRRAGERCEYCHLPTSAPDPVKLPHRAHHREATQGSDDLDNLALACERCNLHKGPNLSAVDPKTNQAALLYHPRRDQWQTHFTMRQFIIVGLTATGRATARLLQMNAPAHVRLRAKLNLLT